MTPESRDAADLANHAVPTPAIPDYELLRRIGRGGYGDVWLARGLTGAYRAVKVVWRDRFENHEPFQREFRGVKESMASSLEAGQLALLHVGQNEPAGFFYYVMELADDIGGGRTIDPARYVPLTLKELQKKRGRLPAAECINLAIELARALRGLHGRGLVHRDIKPSNIVLVNGVPKLADVGLVAASTDARTFVGTQGYMPPEGPGTPAADVFALGKVIYELATGFERDEFPKLPAEFPDAADRRALFDLNEVILRACDPLPGKRYRNASEMLADLTSLAAGKPLRQRRARRTAWLAGTALVAAAIAVAVWWRPAPKPFPAGKTAITPAGMTQSIAVLPFENLSPDPANAYFTDGMHAEVILTLARIPDLRVISRTTALTFRASTLSLPEIGRRLDVEQVLTGSVRREEKHVRVQLDLRRTSDEVSVWQKTFDRELQPGFALQDEIAAEVARVLNVRMDAGWYSGARFMTRNPEAYDLFLQARGIPAKRGPIMEGFREQARLGERIMELDPEFMSGASLTSSAYAYLTTITEGPERSAAAASAKRWAERASELMPGGAGDGALAVYYYLVEPDPARTLLYAENEVRALPNDANGHNRLGNSLAAYGRMDEALASYSRALELDPMNIRTLGNRLTLLAKLRRRAEFEAAVTSKVAADPGSASTGSHEEMRARLTGQVTKDPAEIARFTLRLYRIKLLLFARLFSEVLAETAETVVPGPGDIPGNRFEFLVDRAVALDALGRREERLAVGRQLLALADAWDAAEAAELTNQLRRIRALALADRTEEAVQSGRRLLQAETGPARAANHQEAREALAEVHALAGQPKECVELLAQLLREPTLVTVGYLQLSPIWDKVRADPAFQALLRDPRNSAPL